MALVLIVDDEPGMHNTIRRILEGCGHRVLNAQDGKVGLQVLKESHPDVALVDLFMPEKEGIQTIREMRAERPAVKIIAMSGGGKFGINLLSGLEFLGADSTLEKPFRKDQLLGEIDRVLSR